ncbi:hypothetical protein RAA17_15955 [Komagataeibacter rhaeticus]|nr:hypothetical protein [Komagataeibacter rhaeticus]
MHGSIRFMPYPAFIQFSEYSAHQERDIDVGICFLPDIIILEFVPDNLMCPAMFPYDASDMIMNGKIEFIQFGTMQVEQGGPLVLPGILENPVCLAAKDANGNPHVVLRHLPPEHTFKPAFMFLDHS